MDKYLGKRLGGRYDILEVTGVGGMAYVYKAKDILDNRVVAVKILKDEFISDKEALDRFRVECKAISVLNHANIIKVYDVCFGENIAYIVMEYVDGITLKEYIEQQRVVRWKEAIYFVTQILRALQHAHDKGIIHRDIKPQNIMLLQDGTIKITDFGIARFSKTNVRAAVNNSKAIGSVHYISPEQAKGEESDERSDIYSSGVILYELVTGQLPFDGDSAVSIAIMQIQSEPKNPSLINDAIPEGLEEITLRAMQKDPSKRYQTAADMLRDIDEFKRNPSIHFEYKYFIDDTPTKYVDAINSIKMKENSDDDEDFYEDTKKKSSVLPVLGAIVAALVIFAVLFIVVVAVLNNVFSTSDTVDLPNLTGMTIKEVNENHKFSITIENKQYSNEVEKDRIISQDPTPPKKVKPYDEIKVIVSLGPNNSKMPNVIGKGKDEAVAILDALKLEYKISEIEDEEVESGNVIKTVPSSGELISPNEKIIVYVSSGKEAAEKKVPDLIGLNRKKAEDYLNTIGLTLGEVEERDSEKPEGEILEIDPPFGTILEEGDAVKIIISNGHLATKTVKFDVDLPTNLTQHVYLRIFKNDTEISRSDELDPMTKPKYLLEVMGSGEADIKVKISTDPNNYFVDYVTYTVDFYSSTVTVKESWPYNPFPNNPQDNQQNNQNNNQQDNQNNPFNQFFQ